MILDHIVRPAGGGGRNGKIVAVELIPIAGRFKGITPVDQVMAGPQLQGPAPVLKLVLIG